MTPEWDAMIRLEEECDEDSEDALDINTDPDEYSRGAM
jgi:hypothetical protein